MRHALLLLAMAAAGCSREPPLFVEANAQAHISMLAGTIGSRPVGSPANAKAREYLVDQLKQIGLDVRVQETDARRHELGRTARVANIIGVLAGERPEALALVTHYDSSPDAPGATDSALGVGVVLEAARVLAAVPVRRWSVFVLLTDGEESELMGAAGLVTDREVSSRVQAYVNLDAIGSSGPPLLFEAGPDNGWLVASWARSAPHPRGGSYALEIYRRLPNDTDFSILKTRGIPGLNFAPVGDSYAYHTTRDTPDRLSRGTIRRAGENVVALVHALQGTDITRRTPGSAVYFDVGGTIGVTYGTGLHLFLAGAALALGMFAWLRLTRTVIAARGVLPWLLALVWAWLGAAAAAGAMIGATWLLRAAREVYHPWYARPGRLFVLLLAVGALGAWSTARLGMWLPARARPLRGAALTWSAALPVWIVLAGAALWAAPSGAYLWILPLLAAGVALAPVPPRNDSALRVASLLVLAVSGTLWLQNTHDLLRFTVAAMGRLPVVTPAPSYALILSAAAIMIAPPLVALLAPARPLGRPWLVTSVLLFATAGAAAAAYMAPAYTAAEPLRRHVRALQEAGEPSGSWEVASTEPGLDLGPGAPSGWMRATSAPEGTSVPWGRYPFPFVFRTQGPSLGPAPADVAGFELAPLADGHRLRLTIVPREPALTVTIVLPSGVTPSRSSLPGAVRHGRWWATFAGVPPHGVTWEGSFRDVAPHRLGEARIVVSAATFPGGAGRQGLPAWLPQENTAWSGTATWVVPAATGTGIAPVPPLR